MTCDVCGRDALIVIHQDQMPDVHACSITHLLATYRAQWDELFA